MTDDFDFSEAPWWIKLKKDMENVESTTTTEGFWCHCSKCLRNGEPGWVATPGWSVWGVGGVSPCHEEGRGPGFWCGCISCQTFGTPRKGLWWATTGGCAAPEAPDYYEEPAVTASALAQALEYYGPDGLPSSSGYTLVDYKGYAKNWIDAQSKSMREFLNLTGIRADRPLAMACADFYLLERMNADNFDLAIPVYRDLCLDLSQEFSHYLDFAIGGELRHLRYTQPEFSDDLNEYITFAAEQAYGRRRCWVGWWGMRARHTSAQHRALLREGTEIFGDYDYWDGGFGGENWQLVGKVLLDYLEGVLKPSLFIDRCWTLRHNNNFVFDKAYAEYGLKQMLTLQAEDKYEALACYADDEVRRLWELAKEVRYRGRDPVWLGVQLKGGTYD